MSKVKIQGSASGSAVYTLTTGSTSTDRTITLPDGTGTLLTTDGDGSSLTGVGVDGISSSADATAITIDSSENVGIGVTPESWHTSYTALQFAGNGGLSGWGNQQAGAAIFLSQNSYVDPTNWKYISTDEASRYEQVNGTHTFSVAPSGTADAAISWTDALEITNDGRGLSQFTAKGWINFNGTGTIAARDSHNVSSITDNDTGDYTVTWSNNFTGTGNTYAVVGAGGRGNSILQSALAVISQNSTSVRFGTSHTNGTAVDSNYCNIATFGD